MKSLVKFLPVLMMVAVREQQALIPDLDKIEQLLAEVL